MEKEISENIDSLEFANGTGTNNDSDGGNGTGSGTGSGIDGEDFGPVGSGNEPTSGGSSGSSGSGGASSADSGASGGSSGESSGNGLGRESGDIPAPGGIAADSPGSDAAAPRRGRGRPRRDRSDRASGGNDSGTDSRGQNVKGSRLADLGSQKEPKAVDDKVFDESDLSKLSKSEIVEMVAKVLQGIFYMIAGALKQEHWLLTNREAADLGAATWECFKTLPTKQNKKLEKWLKEYAPYVKLLMVGGAIIGGRAAYSLEIAKVKRIEKQNADLGVFRGGTDNGASADNGNGGFPIATDDFIIG